MQELFLGKEVTVYVDRQIGSRHPEYPMYYDLNYGYIKDAISADSEYTDAYILDINTPVQTYTGIVIAIIKRLNDNEDKLVVSNVPKSRDEIIRLTYFQEKYFNIEIIMDNK